MHKHPDQISNSYVVIFHMLVLGLAMLSLRHIPVEIRGKALFIGIVLPLLFFWGMYFRHQFTEVTSGVILRLGAAYVLASAGAMLLAALGGALVPGQPVINVSLIGSYTYTGPHPSIIFASAIVFSAYLTYVFSVLMISTMEMVANLVVAGSTSYATKTMPASRHLEHEKSLHLNGSLFFLHQRQSMIITMSLMALFVASYLGVILF